MDTQVLPDVELRQRMRRALLRRDVDDLFEIMGIVGDLRLGIALYREEQTLLDTDTVGFWQDTLWGDHGRQRLEQLWAESQGVSWFHLYTDRLAKASHAIPFYGHPIVLVSFAKDSDFVTKPMCFEHGPDCRIGRYLATKWEEEHQPSDS